MSQDATPDSLDPSLSHLQGTSQHAQVHMVDVGQKAISRRRATARARLAFPPGVLDRLLAGAGPKGAVSEVARIAGMLAAKKTGELIPLCHPLGLDHVDLQFERLDQNRLELRCETSCEGRTGVEMESLVGAALAALTVYDMGKGLDKGIRIEEIRLLAKSGGASGDWRAPEAG